jgi:hypothetical protein
VSAEPLLAADLDDQIDIYQRFGGTTALVSTGPGDDGTCAGFDCDHLLSGRELGAAYYAHG